MPRKPRRRRPFTEPLARNERESIIRTARANLEIEGITIPPEILDAMAGYIDGTVTFDDMRRKWLPLSLPARDDLPGALLSPGERASLVDEIRASIELEGQAVPADVERGLALWAAGLISFEQLERLLYPGGNPNG